MKLFLLDWGKKCNGSRYAIISARNKRDLWFHVDKVGCLCHVLAKEINNDKDSPDSFYLELPTMDESGKIQGGYCQSLNILEDSWQKVAVNL